MIHHRTTLLTLGTAMLFAGLSAQGFDLVNGKTAEIVLPEKPYESSRLAAKELSDYTKKVTGKELKIVSGKSGAANQVIIGTLDTVKDLPSEIRKKLAQAKQKEAHYILAKGNQLYIIGRRDVSELYATYQFIEDKLGVRFLKASDQTDSGEYIPKKEKITFKDYAKFREPAFAVRRLDSTGIHGGIIPERGHTWAFRLGYQAYRAYGIEIPYDKPESKWYRFYAPRTPLDEVSLGGGHTTFVRPQPAKTAFEKHPEYFAMIDGKRVKGQQYCLSNPDVRRNTANDIIAKLDKYKGRGAYLFGMVDVNDGWCECAECRKLDGSDTTAGGFQNVSTRFQKTVKAIADMVYQKYPNADLRVWAYHTYRQLPNGVRHDPRIKVQYCTHGRCYGHALDDPNCARNVPFHKLLHGWLNVTPKVYTYDYLFCTAPYYTCNEKIQAHDLRLFHKLGMEGWKEEASFSDSSFWPVRKNDPRPDIFASNWQYLYVVGKLLWDPSLDENKIIDEIESLYYGKAYPAMKKYHALRRKLWANTTQCMGYPHGDQRRPNLLNAPGSKEELLKYLAEADKLAKGDKLLEYRLSNDRRWLTKYWIKPNDEMKAKFGKTMRAPVANSPITIDGDGRDPAWVGAYYLTNSLLETFTQAHKPMPEKLRTTVGILSDRENLYFLITAMEPNMKALKPKAVKRDDAVWNEDSIEIFLYPPTAANNYYHICISPKGVIYDTICPGDKKEFDLPVQVKTKLLADRYVIEVKIPTSKLKMIENGDIWRVNIARNRSIHDSYAPLNEKKRPVTHFSLDGSTFHDTTAYRPMEIGNALLVNGSFEELNQKGNPKGWELTGKSKPVKTGKSNAVHVDGYMYQLMTCKELNQSPKPRKIAYTFKASGKGRLSVEFFRYTDTVNPKAKYGYTRKLNYPHGKGGVYELTGKAQIITGEYTIEPNTWGAICFFAKDATIDDVSVRLVK